MWTKCFDSLQKQSASNLLMTVLRWYFWCGSTMFHVVTSVCVSSPAIFSPEQQLPIMLSVSSVLLFKIENK